MFDLLKLIQLRKQLQLSLVGVNGMSDKYRHCFGCEAECSGSCSGLCEDTCVAECQAEGCGGSCSGACYDACTSECTGIAEVV